MIETKTAASGVAPALPGAFFPVLLVLCGVFLPPPPAAAVDVPGAGGIVVNGDTVEADQVWQEYNYQNSLRKFIHARPDDVVDEKLLKSVIEQKVRKHLLLQEARRLGFTLGGKDAEDVRQAQVTGWKGEANFQNALAMIGVEERFVLNRAEETLLIKRMLAAGAKAEEGVTKEALLEFYEGNPGRYLPEELPPLRYIFHPREEGNSREVFTLVAREAETLRVDGKSYASLVERYSKHESASGGGIVPGRPKGEAGLPLQPVEGGLKECRISSYRTDEKGMHIYLQDCRHPLPLGEVEERVREDLLADRRSEFGNALISRLEDKASVSYLPLEGPPPVTGGGGKGH